MRGWFSTSWQSSGELGTLVIDRPVPCIAQHELGGLQAWRGFACQLAGLGLTGTSPPPGPPAGPLHSVSLHSITCFVGA